MIVIYVKLGTLSAQMMTSVRKRREPEVGETVDLKPVRLIGSAQSGIRYASEPFSKKERAVCTEIRDLGDGAKLFFMEKM